MFAPVDLLLSNLVTLGVLLVILLIVWTLSSRSLQWMIEFVARRMDPKGEGGLLERWSQQMSRLLAAIMMVVGLALVTGATLLTFYEIDAIAFTREWAEKSISGSDPISVAWTVGEVLGVLIAAPILRALLRGFLNATHELLGGASAFKDHEEALTLLYTRLHGTVRVGVLFCVLVALTYIATDSEQVQYIVALLTYIVVGVSLARSIVAGLHIVVDLCFDISGALSSKKNPLRYLGRLKGLASLTRRVTDYFVYVGTATLISHQIAPDTLLAQWGQAAIRVLAILYVARVIVELVEVMLREALAGKEHSNDKVKQQRETLVPVATSLARYAIYLCSITMALGELGVDTTPLFAAAGLMGIAVGLGAQSIVSDLVSGFFVLFEGIYYVGHRVKIGDDVGVVEEIGVRVTRIRDEHGVVHAIPNGEIRCVSSYSQGYVNAIVDFTVSYQDDLRHVINVVSSRFPELLEEHDDLHGPIDLDVEELREFSIVLRVTARVAPGVDKQICDVLTYEIASILAAEGIRTSSALWAVRSDPQSHVHEESE